MHSLELTGTLAFPQIDSPFVEHLVRWGADGFAFIAGGAWLNDQELYLMRSSIAQPQSPNPVPSLSSLSLGSSVVEQYGLLLVIDGAGFVPSSVGYWNATALQTSFISSTRLTVMLPNPASGSNTTGQVTVTNPAPGGGTSNALPYTIVSNPSAIPSSFSLDFGTVGLGASSSAQTVSLSNTGKAALSISSIAVTGDFSSTNTCRNFVPNQSACEISVIFTPAATGQRVGTITITDNGGNSPQSISLNGVGATSTSQPAFTLSGTAVTVTPGATTANTSTVTVTPTGGFTGSVTLTAAVTSSPANAQYPPTLSFGSTSPVSITGTDAGTATLTISTTPSSTSSCTADNRMQRGVPWYAGGGAVLACVLMFGIPIKRRRWRSMLGMLALIVVFGGGVLACGGGGGGISNCPTSITSGTTAGAYTVTVTGTSGTITATGTVALTVQ
jgi:hypothetical protein